MLPSGHPRPRAPGFTALSSLPGSCGAAAVVPSGWEDGCSQAVWAAALEELHPAGRLVPRSRGAASLVATRGYIRACRGGLILRQTFTVGPRCFLEENGSVCARGVVPVPGSGGQGCLLRRPCPLRRTLRLSLLLQFRSPFLRRGLTQVPPHGTVAFRTCPVTQPPPEVAIAARRLQTHQGPPLLPPALRSSFWGA